MICETMRTNKNNIFHKFCKYNITVTDVIFVSYDCILIRMLHILKT